MRREATFDSSFWVHAVYLELVDFLLADYVLLCTQSVATELGRENPTSLRLKARIEAKTIQVVTPRSKKIQRYGDGERAAMNLAQERKLLLLIDDWRPYEAAQAAGIEVVNTVAYLVQLYKQSRIPLERILDDLGRLTRRGTFRPAWIQSALRIVAEIHKKDKEQ